MSRSTIGDTLFTKTQQRVLGLLFGNPEKSYYSNELVRLAGVGKGSLLRELDKFCKAGLVTVARQGNQNHYQANAESPIFAELKGIVQKTFGVTEVVRASLATVMPKIEQAFIYGSLAKGTERASSDVDLLLVGDGLSYGDVMTLLEPAEQELARKINPTIYDTLDYTMRVDAKQSFITRVMQQPKLWLKGVES